MRRIGLVAAVALATAVAPAQAAATSCKPVRDVFEGTRYEGSDLYRIRANGVSCARARRVANRATYRALGIPVPGDPIKRFGSRGWSVTDDLRGDADRLSARAPGRRVTWRFGEL
jgi:hypothetical protein